MPSPRDIEIKSFALRAGSNYRRAFGEQGYPNLPDLRLKNGDSI